MHSNGQTQRLAEELRAQIQSCRNAVGVYFEDPDAIKGRTGHKRHQDESASVDATLCDLIIRLYRV